MTTPRELAEIWLDDEPQPIDLSAGRFALQLRRDCLSDITFDGRIVLRGIRFVVRDHDWRTVPAELVSLRVEGSESEGALRLGMHVRNRDGEAQLEWDAVVDLGVDELRIAVHATVQHAFLRNRIGIVLLHPPSCAGRDLSVRHPSGSVTRTRFPVEISPHQPARDIAGLEWTDGVVRSQALLTGDVFEMEDQRNWTDASFKTYSTPLSQPFPVHVRAGDTIEQQVILRCAPEGAGTAHSTGPIAPADPGPAPEASEVAFGVTPRAPVMPQIAVGASTAPDHGAPESRFAWLGPSPVLVELEAASRNWPTALRRAVHEAGAGALDVRIVASTPQQVDEVLDGVADPVTRLARIGVFDAASHVSEPALWNALVSGAAARRMPAELVGGVRSHFTELNRNHHRLPAELPSLAFSLTPQMHDLERAQVIESLAMQREVAEQAVRIAGSRPVHIGPVTLRARFNAVATSATRSPAEADLRHGYGAELVDGAADPRQRSHGYAAWLIASVAALAVPGVASITLAETWGPRGFEDALGERYPASYAAEWLIDVAGWLRRTVAPALPVGPIAALAARSGDDSVVLLANASTESALISLRLDALTGDGIPSSGTMLRLPPGAREPIREALVPASELQMDLVLAPGEIARWSTVG